MVIQHNLMALFAKRENNIVRGRLRKSTEKLSSGYRINRSADDAAGLAISEEMRRQIRGLNRGAVNILEGIGYCQTADGALNEMHDMIQRVNELAIQAANGTNSDDDRAYISDEIDQLKTEIDRICTTTKYNEEYIFKTDETWNDSIMPYELSFTGFPRNMYIYNETYDDATGDVTYGGIAYNGKRYAWSSISVAMYDTQTGEFREGTYTLKADDGTWLTLTCENGSKPPQVSCEYTTDADSNGIYVNGELIRWDDVKDASGASIDKEYVDPKEYYFNYHGVTVSFTPDIEDDFNDVISKISDTLWKSTYRLPYENTALYGDFSKTGIAFKDNQEVKNYLDGTLAANDKYTIRASDGTNGSFDGIWLELNGTEVTDSRKSWADLGITNWGDQSTDIWENIIYTYNCRQSDKHSITFSFDVINEISKDSAIDALDGVVLSPFSAVDLKNHAEAEFAGNNANILGAEVVQNSIKLTLREEYGLGRDYSQATDTYGSESMAYDKATISVGYSKTVDGNTIQKEYVSTAAEVNGVVGNIKNTIKQSLTYLDIIKARYQAGAKDPAQLNLSQLVSAGNITGGGKDTYLEDAYSLNVSDPRLITTLKGANNNYAGASIDFSGLGTSYGLADLIGMGFNSTCQTCNNHYSIQFMTPDAINTKWKSASVNGNNYQYSMETQGNNYTLYIDVNSMQGSITDGVDFTNALVGIIDAAGYDFHFTQYATYSDEAKLYVFDNRPYYAQNGTSTAKDAEFQPHAFDMNTVADFTVKLYDKDDVGESMGIRYKYDYSDLFSTDKLYFDVTKDNINGNYVYNAVVKTYEKYDASNPAHVGADRYIINDISLETHGATIDQHLDDYIRDTVLNDVTSETKLNLVGDSAVYKVNADVNDNAAMLTEYNTPYQIMPPEVNDLKGTEFLNIQCSSNTKDFIRIQKQKLSLQRLGLLRFSVKTESKATKAIALAEKALKIVSKIRSTFGAYQNRLEHSYAINQNTAENTQYAESKIRDTDMAKEMVKYSNANILAQVGESMLAQANQNNQAVVSLLG